MAMTVFGYGGPWLRRANPVEESVGAD